MIYTFSVCDFVIAINLNVYHDCIHFQYVLLPGGIIVNGNKMCVKFEHQDWQMFGLKLSKQQ